MVVVGTSSQKRADQAVSLMISTFPGMAMGMLGTNVSPAGSMTNWLSGLESPAMFGIDVCCELKDSNEAKTKIKYVSHNLDIEEIKAHIVSGMTVSSLDLTWSGRVSFTLTDALVLKNIELLHDLSETPEGSVDAFDADVFLLTTELLVLIQDLVDALGGQVEASKE
jgi:recombination associated protein RdgC